MKLEEVRQHWENAGKDFPVDSRVTPTTRDPYLGELERKNIHSVLCLTQINTATTYSTP